MATRTTKTTTTRRSTASKTKAKAPTKAKKSTAATATPVVVDSPTPVVAGPMMRKKELVEAVVARSGMKKKDIKPAVEATLAVLGEALQDGRTLNLQPMGKVKINREKKLASGRILVARIRQADKASSTEADTASDAPEAPAADKAAAE